jgi:Zn-dependent M28 family amino/carboxypeptidase
MRGTGLRSWIAAGLLGFRVLAPGPGSAAPDAALVRQAVARIDPERLMGRIQSLQDFGTRHSYRPESAAVAAWIAERLRALGYEVELEPVPWLGQTWHNVLATRRGTRTPERLYVLGAHYDSQAGGRFQAEAVAPGADDNASGLAGVLEAAEALAPYSFASSVRFVAFAGEEQMLRGSLMHVGRLDEDLEHAVQAAIVLEMIGYTGPTQRAVPGCPAPPERGDFLGALSNRASRELLQRFVLASALHVPELPVQTCVNDLVPRSDHFPFWLGGYAALMLTDTANYRNPYYHTAEDRIETLDPAFAARSTRSAVALFAELAGIEPLARLPALSSAGLWLLAGVAALGLARLRTRLRPEAP